VAKDKVPITVEEFAATKNYLAPSLFSFGFPISEYDISKANINILRSYQKITEEEYHKLLILPKMDREIEIGKRIIFDWTIQEIIDKGIAAAKYQFLTVNKIKLQNILRIANDAFYLIGNNPILTSNVLPEGGTTPISFLYKKKFNIYMKLNSVLFFANDEGFEWDIDVIGIGNDKIEMHRDFISFLCSLSDQYIFSGKEMAIKYLNDFHQKYTTNQLEIGFYREFNATGCFRYNQKNNTYLSLLPITGNNEQYLDRSYNLSLIRTIYAYLLAAN